MEVVQKLDNRIRLIWCLIIISIIIMIGRCYYPGRQISAAETYVDFAHIFCGFLFACIWFNKARWWALGLLLLITVFEVIMFILQVGI